MPVPKYGLISAGAPGGQVPPEVRVDGVTELRIHGVGGTSPETLLNDLAPEQVAGDNIAGFYRTADQHSASGTVSRHVEGYSWGGLTSRSSWRVFWLLLLPFLLGNLAGWMCSARTKGNGPPGWRFRVHRASANLACLALTINLVLVTAMITADVAGYQAVRAGGAEGRWWLAPLRWPGISGHPARQVLLGIAAVALVIVLLAALATVTRSRYERVPPPYNVASRPRRALTVAAALANGLSDQKFWDGEHSVRHSATRHVAASLSFLALVLAITGKDTVEVVGDHAHATAWWWAALIGGGTVIAFVIIRTCTDFRNRQSGISYDFARRFDDWSARAVLVVAIAATGCAGIFAWLQPAAAAVAGQLPGMAGIAGWTMTTVAVILGLVLLSSAAGGWQPGTLLMGPMVIMILAFSLLNVAMFGGMLSFAHLLGDLTFAATPQAAQIYLPELVGFGVPALVIAALAAVFLFGCAELLSWWLAGRGEARKAVKDQYGSLAAGHPDANGQYKAGTLDLWRCSALEPPGPDGHRHDGERWPRRIARAQRIGKATHDAAWLLWILALSEIAAAVVTVTLHPSIAPDRWYGKAAIALAAALPLFLIGLLRAGWGQQDRRRRIGVLWDVGTFWPRSYHPLAPPCYAERAVPDLQRRLWWIHDNNGSVLIAGHSQGSVLAAAALIQSGCLPAGNQAALATFGCPLGKLYSWAFPGYVNDDVLARLSHDGGPDWVNFFYPTDPVGGCVFRPGREPGVDVALLDPAGPWYNYGQPQPAPGGHSGYWTDPRVWERIQELVDPLYQHRQRLAELDDPPAGAAAEPVS
jgi:hypothetical protein